LAKRYVTIIREPGKAAKIVPVAQGPSSNYNPVEERTERTEATIVPTRYATAEERMAALRRGETVALPSGKDINEKRNIVRQLELEAYGTTGEVTKQELGKLESRADEILKARREYEASKQSKISPQQQQKDQEENIANKRTVSYLPKTAEQLRPGMEDVLAERLNLPIAGAFGPQKEALRNIAIGDALRISEENRKRSLKEISENTDAIYASQKGIATEDQYKKAEEISSNISERNRIARLTSFIFNTREDIYKNAENDMEQSEARLKSLRSVVPLTKDTVSRRIRTEIIAEQANIENKKNVMLAMSGMPLETSKTDFSKTEEQANIILKNENFGYGFRSLPGRAAQAYAYGAANIGKAAERIFSLDQTQMDRDITRLERKKQRLITGELSMPDSTVDIYGTSGETLKYQIDVLQQTEAELQKLKKQKGRRDWFVEYAETPTKGGKALAFGTFIGASIPLLGITGSAIASKNVAAGIAYTGTVKGAEAAAATAFAVSKATEYGSTKTEEERAKFGGETAAELTLFTLGAAPASLIASGGRMGEDTPKIKFSKIDIGKINTKDTISTFTFEGYTGAQPLVSITKETPVVTKIAGGERFVTTKELEGLPFNIKQEKKIQTGTPRYDFTGVKEFTPGTKTELKILYDNVINKNPRMKKQIDIANELTKLNEKVESKFGTNKLPLKDIETLSEEQAEIVFNFGKKKRGKLFGSASQKIYQSEEQFMKGRGKSTVGDTDLQLNQKEAQLDKDVGKLIDQLNKVTGGYKARRNPSEQFLIETKVNDQWRHAVDLKAIDTESTATAEKIFGMILTQRSKKIEGLRTSRLSEQGLRKGASIFTLRSNIRENVIPEFNYGEETSLIFSPASHRGKDIGDFFSVQETLSKSAKDKAKAKRAEKLLKELEEYYPKSLREPGSKRYEPQSEIKLGELKLPRSKSILTTGSANKAMENLFGSGVSTSKKSSMSLQSQLSNSYYGYGSPSKSASLMASKSFYGSLSPSGQPSKVSKYPSKLKSSSPSRSLLPSTSPSISPSPYSPSPSPSPYIYREPKVPPAIIPPFFSGGGGGYNHRKSAKRSMDQVYTPDFTAKVLGLTTEIKSQAAFKKLLSKEFTGLEIRGVPIFNIKHKKRKKKR